MSVNIGTSTTSYATGYSNQRKIVRTSTNKLVLFANLGDASGARLRYKTSDDDGDTWSSWILAYDWSVTSFGVHIDTNDDILLVVNGGGTTQLEFIKLIYQSGDTWNNGTVYPVHTSGFKLPVITRRSNGDIWVSAFLNALLGGFYSTDEGQTWTNVTFNTGYQPWGISVVPHDTEMWAFSVIYGGSTYDLKVYKFNPTYVSETIIGTNLIIDNTKGISALKISDSNIWVTATSSSGIKIFNWNGSVWDSGTLISDNINDESPSLSNVNGNPVVVWRDYNGSQYDIVYRLYNGISWETQVSITNDVTSDDFPSTLNSDNNNLYSIYTKGDSSPYNIYFNKTVFSTEVISDINNDFRTLKKFTLEDITNDFRMAGTSAAIDILNDFRLIGAILEDVNNDFRMAGTFVIEDINNDFRFSDPPIVTEVESDIYNLFTFVTGNIKDIINDIRTQKEEVNNITNDFRMIASFQIPGSTGFQSLGKEYIKVYIDGVEQIDVNINSIVINKVLSDAHVASFDLGRAYDSTKPDMKAVVEIKYHIWTIYKGYIVNISPADSPESIRINCNDKYWLNNKTKKYFHVGHKPQDNMELYYNTIQEALNTEFTFSVDIGSFIPQTIDCFGKEESDGISSLIQLAGNYEWFYKEDETKKLWEAGKGNIINLEAQTLNTNLGLHQIIRHQFKEDIEGIINKFRVQMGEKTTRTFNNTGGTKTYNGYNYRQYRAYAKPEWDSSYESRFGSEHMDKGGKKYVFIKYRLPYLDPELEEYSDYRPPVIELYNSGQYGFESGIMSEGFTIDYTRGLLIFDEPMFSYSLDSTGNMTYIRRPGVGVQLWKKKYYSYTVDPTEDPETDVSNPLMFFTDKMGTYPDTIIENLELTNLSIQEGYTYYWWRFPGFPKGIHYPAAGFIKEVEEHVPSWDDTEFALDYANWELSKICDKKISGSIDITLDTFLFYNIDLSKRIMINGVIDDPLNITSITINTSTFIVTLNLESMREYRRTINLQSRGE